MPPEPQPIRALFAGGLAHPDTETPVTNVRVRVEFLPALRVAAQESVVFSPSEEGCEPGEFAFPTLTVSSARWSSPS